MLAWFLLGATLQGVALALFFTILFGIAVTDARTYIIPDEFSIGGTVLGLLISFLPGGITPQSALIGAVAGFGLLYLIAALGEWWLKKPAMGGGDIKMMAMIGAFLGTQGMLLTLFLGSLLGTLLIAPFPALRSRWIPFGIFLSIGAFASAVFGKTLIHWYLTVYLG